MDNNQKRMEYKLNQIADIWNHYIFDHWLCNKHIRFNDEAKTNYFGEILHYFHDTFEIIYGDEVVYGDYKKGQFKNSLMYKISLLQSIYVQQDLIEELLLLFKCGIVKGDLKQNINYSINRDVRNELVGHPLRRPKGKLISSSIFSHEPKENMISYFRYHKDNNYKYENLDYEIDKIIERHSAFLDTYFDLIINKLSNILEKFKNGLKKYLERIPKLTFSEVLTLTELNYPTIFDTSCAYKIDNLKYIYENIDKHPRYKAVIDNFLNDLKEVITEGIENINSKVDFSKYCKSLDDNRINVKIASSNDKTDTENNNENEIIIRIEKATINKNNFNYELSKLVSNKQYHLFKWNKNNLINKIGNNQLIIDELNHMEDNFDNDFEYHCSFNYISRMLYQFL